MFGLSIRPLLGDLSLEDRLVADRNQVQTLNFKVKKEEDPNNLLSLVGKQIGLMVSEMGTLSFNRSKAMSLSKLVRVNLLAMARSTKRVSGRVVALQRLCSPNVTLIINHMNLKHKGEIN